MYPLKILPTYLPTLCPRQCHYKDDSSTAKCHQKYIIRYTDHKATELMCYFEEYVIMPNPVHFPGTVVHV